MQLTVEGNHIFRTGHPATKIHTTSRADDTDRDSGLILGADSERAQFDKGAVHRSLNSPVVEFGGSRVIPACGTCVRASLTCSALT